MDYTAPYEGNFICSIKNLGEHINELNGKLVYLFPKKAHRISWVKELEDNVAVHYMDRDVMSKIKVLRKIIKNENINIVHAHFCLPKTQLAVKIACCFSRNVYLVQHYHNHYKLPDNFLKKQLFKFMLKGDLNIGCSDSVADSIIYDRNKIVSITNAIDFKRLDEYKKINRKSIGLKEDSKVILMFGFDYYRKGVDIAINGIREIAKGYNIELVIVISVGMDNIKRNIINEFGEIPSFVKLVNARSDIAAYYNLADIFISSAREEGFCYSLVEAMYCNTKCVSSNIEGPPLNIPNLKIFDNEDYKDLSIKIKGILDSDSKTLDEENDVTKKYVTNEYSIDKWSNEVIENYNKLLCN